MIKGSGLFDVWSRSVQAVRTIRHKPSARKYPQVNVEEVVLDKPRYGYRKERPPLLSQSVTDSIFPSEEIRRLYMKEGKAVPIKHRSHSDKIAKRNYERFAEEVAMGMPHFKVGDKEIYLPKARISLLRPNAKHSPYQAKFVVPRNFNKLDLRDYLWHVYGLRALNVTVQLLHAKFERGFRDLGRFRGTQYKKMTIDMEEPFIWPDLPPEAKQFSENLENQRKLIESRNGAGADKDKPTDAYDGLYEKPSLPNKFITKNFKQKSTENIDQYNKKASLQDDKAMVNKFLGF